MRLGSVTLAHFGHDWCWRRDQIKRAKILPDLDQMRERERADFGVALEGFHPQNFPGSVAVDVRSALILTETLSGKAHFI